MMVEEDWVKGPGVTHVFIFDDLTVFGKGSPYRTESQQDHSIWGSVELIDDKYGIAIISPLSIEY